DHDDGEHQHVPTLAATGERNRVSKDGVGTYDELGFIEPGASFVRGVVRRGVRSNRSRTSGVDRVSIEATYDWLNLVLSAARIGVNGLLPSEVQALSYLASALAWTNGLSANDWGYRFTATPMGTPFASSLDAAVEDLQHSGHCVA